MPRRSLRAAAAGLHLLLAGGFFAAAAAAPAQQPQSAAVSGQVRDPQGLVVEGAAVRLLGANRVLLAEVRTDAEGRFALPPFPPGRYELRVEAAGFAAHQRVLDLPAAARAPLEVSLRLTPVEFQVTVSGSGGAPEESFLEPAAVRLRGREELAAREPAHLPRALAEEPGVLVQETTPGQGSPVLRGQTAQAVLYLVDGVRFNNSTYRSGNTQYLGWLPAAAVEGVEIFLGPAGTRYGSDALGGAVGVMTRPLPPWTDRGWHAEAETTTFFSSADLAGGGTLRAAAVGPRLGLSLAGGYRRHQAVRSGGGVDSHNALVRWLGLAPEQARGILGSRLRQTDYLQADWSARVGARLSESEFLTLTWLESEQGRVRRYDRLLGGDGRLRSDLGPQRLGFGYARYQRLGAGVLRSLAATFSINRQTDGRTEQARSTSTLSNEINRATTLGYQLSTAWAPLRRHQFTAGAEFYDEFIFARRLDAAPGQPAAAVRPRFPDGARYGSFGAFLTDDWELVPERVHVELGARASYFRFRSRAAENVFFDGQPAVPDARETFRDITFNAGLTWRPVPAVAVVGRVARGFRAPNVFDLGEQGLTGGGLEISPAEAVELGADVGSSAGRDALTTGRAWRPLGAEVLWSFEGGLRWRHERASGEVTFYDTELLDAIERRVVIVRAPVVGAIVGGHTVIAQDNAGRIFTAADPRPVVSRVNIGRVRLRGAEASARMVWGRGWSATVKAAALRGRELDSGLFARRVPPDFLFAGVRWSERRGRLWLELFAEAAGAQTRLNPAELDDPRIGAFRDAAGIAAFFEHGARRLGLIENDRLAETGETVDEVIARVLGPAAVGRPLFVRTPGYGTVGVRGLWRLGAETEVGFAMGNLADRNFRRHGSGFDAPGRSLSLQLLRRFR